MFPKGAPRTLAVHTCGGEAQFQNALRCNELREVIDGANTFYVWSEIETGNVKSVVTASSASRTMNINDETYDNICETLASLSWDFNVAPRIDKNNSTDVPEIAFEKLQTALTGVERVVKDASGVLTSLQAASKTPVVLAAVSKHRQELQVTMDVQSRLQHMLMFKTMPDICPNPFYARQLGTRRGEWGGPFRRRFCF